MGVVSNAAALVVLRRELVQRTFHLLMMFLAVWDAAYLVLSVAWYALIYQVLPHPICGQMCLILTKEPSLHSFSLPTLIPSYRDYVFIHLVPYAIPFAQMCLFASCYSTVAITIER